MSTKTKIKKGETGKAAKNAVCLSLPKNIIDALDEEAKETASSRSACLRGLLINLFEEEEDE